MNRRERLLERATDHVLAHGLIGLSLRPLAAAVGTSDRMLIYHFGSRDQLVTEVIRTANERSVAVVASLPPEAGVRAGVLRLWEAYQREPLSACERLYVQAAASGLLGEEPYRSVVRVANQRWTREVSDWLLRCGAQPDRVDRATRLVDSALLGLHVDLSAEAAEDLATAVEDLAEAAERLAAPIIPIPDPS